MGNDPRDVHFVHVVLSLVAIGAGFVVVSGLFLTLVASKRFRSVSVSRA